MINRRDVLIVEDDPMFYNIINFLLISDDKVSSLVNDVKKTESIEETKSLYESKPAPDIVLLDLNIIDSIGMDTYERMRTIFPFTNIVVVSGNRDEELVMKLIKAGAQEFITKEEITPSLMYRVLRNSYSNRFIQSTTDAFEAKFRTVFERFALPIMTLDGENLEVLSLNESAEELLGVKKRQARGRELKELISLNISRPDLTDRTSFILTRKEYLSPQTKQLHYFDLLGNRIPSNKNVFACLVVDRTDEVLLLREDESFTAKLMEAEKVSIARELHDGFAQHLVAISFMLKTLFDGDESEPVEQLLATISEAQKQLKSIIYDLTPPEMDQGFIEALESLCRRIDSLPNLEVKLTIQEGFSNDFMESIDFINVFRIIQEFVNNSMKHAEASVIEIKVSFSKRLVKIELSDDGVGFDEEKSLKGLGLSSIHHRMLMQDIKGKLESEPGRGTALKMSFSHQNKSVLSN